MELIDKIKTIISRELSIDRDCFYEDSNLTLLFMLSNYLKDVSDDDRASLLVSQKGLTRIDLLKHNGSSTKVDLHKLINENTESYFDISFLFENSENKTFKYYDKPGGDGFFTHQIERISLFMEIESKLDVQISDEVLGKIKNISDIVRAVKEAQRQ